MPMLCEWPLGVRLKGHCHGDFAVCWSKLLKYLIKNLISNMKLSLEHREEHME